MRLDVVGDPEIATRINSFEMAFRMQVERAGADGSVARSRKQMLEMYGAEPGKPSFANNCLLARRLVERGVRFVQLFHEAWDQHGNLVKDLKKNCKDTDQASAALIKDLKQRGLLDETLGHLGRRVRPHADGAGRQRRPRPSSERLHHVAGRRRHQAGRVTGRDRRARLQRRQGQSARARSARHDPASARASITPS